MQVTPQERRSHRCAVLGGAAQLPAARSCHPGAGEGRKALQEARLLQHVVSFHDSDPHGLCLAHTRASRMCGSSDTSQSLSPTIIDSVEMVDRMFWTSLIAQYLLREALLSACVFFMACPGPYARQKCVL